MEELLWLTSHWAPYPIGFGDLGFRYAPVAITLADGEVVRKWSPVGMPRIRQSIPATVFYLFGRKRDGDLADSPSGTGFFVQRVSSGTPGLNHIYAVSNWHVTNREGASNIRLNILGPRKSRFLELDPMEWIFDSAGDDISIVDVTDRMDLGRDQFAVIDENMFISLDVYDTYQVDIGEDTMMIGLFAGHHGGDRNIPSARFGNISMVPRIFSPVKQPNGNERQSYLVDTRSRGGFSGSPVFLYRTFSGDLRYQGGHGMEQGNQLFGVLGIHCSQFWENVRARKAHDGEVTGDPVLDGDILRIEGGMTIVAPAWSISQLLDREEFEMQRKERDQRRRGAYEKLPVPEADAESVSPSPSDANPNHLEDFRRLLDVSVRKPSQEG